MAEDSVQQPSPTPADARWMRAALRAARRGVGHVEPNPPVGCVLVSARGELIATGYHQRSGGPHAEAHALALARAGGIDPAGATAYVSLEPCCSFPGKRTPACSSALLEAGVRRVFVAVEDPHPAVRGRGIAALRAGGADVRVGLLAEAAAELIAPYAHRRQTGRPWVIAKWAQSLDGRIATAAGQSRWISGPAAQRDAHRLRAICDAVLIGAGTLRDDNPWLLPRLPRPARIPARVVVSGRADLPEQARLFSEESLAAGPVHIWTLDRPPGRSTLLDRLQRRGVIVQRVSGGRAGTLGRPQWSELLTQAGSVGWTRLLVEGGGVLLASLLRARIVCETVVYCAGMVLGGDARPAVAAAGWLRLRDAPRLGPLSVRRLDGGDLRVSACVLPDAPDAAASQSADNPAW